MVRGGCCLLQAGVGGYHNAMPQILADSARGFSMNQQPFRAISVPRPIPVVLSFVAGFVDSCTYLGLFGIFVAQVTGSFVLAGTLFVTNEPGALAKLLAIPSFFFAGMAMTVLVHSMREHPTAALAWSLAVECALLIGFLASCLAGMPFRGPDGPGAIVALVLAMAAMGAQSTLVRLLLRGGVSTNVMTTNTTLLAISVAEMLLGCIERRNAGPHGSLNAAYAQAHRDFAVLFPVGLGFLGGTAVGAIAYVTMGLICVSLAVLPVGGLAAWYMRRL
jgi:uncharacterized membrane protein YoaK (UPF0700 family)